MSCLASCCFAMSCGLCSSVASGISKTSARLAYCGLFGLSLIVSWVLREVATPLLKKCSWINTSDTYTKEWYQTQAVLRVSLGNFLFFAILALIMIRVKYQNDRRDSWHHGGWIAKMIIWLLLVVLMFFLPNEVVTVYGQFRSYWKEKMICSSNCLFSAEDPLDYAVPFPDLICTFSCVYVIPSRDQPVQTLLAGIISKFGAGLFLLVQVLLLLDFVHTWNDSWVAKDEQKWYIALLVVSIVCYIAAFAFSGILFIWFNPSGNDCGLNVFFIVMTMVLAFGIALIALHPSVNGSLLPAAVISVYCAYVCYTGLSSEPRGYACNGLHRSKASSITTLILGMLTTVLSVLYSAFRAGSSTTLLSPPSSPKSGGSKPLLEGQDEEEGKEKKKETEEARPVSYSYSFFHLIFALASMYSAMLLSGWTSSSDSSDLVDVGWTSVWVRICTEWVTFALYIWTLLAPVLLPDREFF
ncbi:hypothetical protein EZV62_000517 [Acer yangbiense]|uniref:Serine incorporator n=1 Tax=Acer yangbiense TaxID=1000413 RepID=A0A5C7IS38_9ROSI|nr:hypothetical protein EZV62_000517 [Acer yangbiense]